jgi:uncharacterized repeat protein (TIGR01451 family)
MFFTYRSHHRWAALTLAMLLVSLFAAATVSSADSPGLFSPVETTDAQPQEDLPPQVLRARIARVNLAQLKPGRDDLSVANAADTVRLNLFDDAVLTATLDRIDPAAPGSGAVWIGKVDGSPFSIVMLVVIDGYITGEVIAPGLGRYQVRPTGAGGQHIIRQLDPAAQPDFGDDALLPPTDKSRREAGAQPAETSPGTLADDGSVIDIMIAYTPAARDSAGGTAGILAQIYAAIAYANTAFANSNVNVSLRLVHTAEVNYTETYDTNTDIYRLQDPADSYLDELHILRDAHRADLVSFWAKGDDAQWGTSGRAFLLDDLDPVIREGWAFSVLHIGQSGFAGDTLAHELGHNLGAQHDWFIVDGASFEGLYTYNKGYVNLPGEFLTIMAYHNRCTAAGILCWRTPYFSNPNILVGSPPIEPIGVAPGTNLSCTAGNLNNPDCDADNHLVFGNTAWTVANFRESDPNLIAPVLSMTKTVTLANNPPRSGEAITYTIVIASDGGQADNVIVSDSLPAGINGSHLLQVETITANESLTFTITANIADTVGYNVTITNTAYYTHTSGTDQANAIFTTIADTTPPTFTAGALLTPTGTITDTTPLFDWQDAFDDLSGVVSYTLLISTNNNSLSLQEAGTTITTTQSSFMPAAELAGGVYNLVTVHLVRYIRHSRTF